MASTTFDIDGELRQFQLGQSILDPGIERTDFGVPVNCAVAYESCLAGDALSHYTWALGFTGGGSVMTLEKVVGDNASFGIGPGGSFSATLRCGPNPDVPGARIAIVFIETIFDVTPYYLIEILDAGTTWSFGLSPSTSPPGWFIRLYYLPGP